MYNYYFAMGDNLNAKNLYDYCKGKGKGYPFVRMKCRAFLPDHHMIISNNKSNERYGMITVEDSPGYVTPGIIFEVNDVDNLSVFGDDFVKLPVIDYKNGKVYDCLLNKAEKGNLFSWKKVKLCKGRKKLLRRALRWRELTEFENYFESAMRNVYYPIVLNKIFVSKEFPYYQRIVNSYNTFVCEENVEIKISPSEGLDVDLFGAMVYSNHLRIKNDLSKMDVFLEETKFSYVKTILKDNDGSNYFWYIGETFWNV